MALSSCFERIINEIGAINSHHRRLGIVVDEAIVESLSSISHEAISGLKIAKGLVEKQGEQEKNLEQLEKLMEKMEANRLSVREGIGIIPTGI